MLKLLILITNYIFIFFTAMPNEIIIVEDDIFYSAKLKLILTKAGFNQLLFFKNVDDAYHYCANKIPQLIICDIFLDGTKNGLDLANKLRAFDIPIIFITASIDENLYESAKKINSFNYLIKPIQSLTLISTIEKIFADLEVEKSQRKEGEAYLFIRGADNRFEKIFFHQILYIESDKNYSLVYTLLKKYAIRKSLSQLLTEFDERFVRCLSKYAVNKQNINSVSYDKLFLGNKVIPVGRTYKKGIISHLGRC